MISRLADLDGEKFSFAVKFDPDSIPFIISHEVDQVVMRESNSINRGVSDQCEIYDLLKVSNLE